MESRRVKLLEFRLGVGIAAGFVVRLGGVVQSLHVAQRFALSFSGDGQLLLGLGARAIIGIAVIHRVLVMCHRLRRIIGRQRLFTFIEFRPGGLPLLSAFLGFVDQIEQRLAVFVAPAFGIHLLQ